MTASDFWILVLGAALHDIGKVVLRADAPAARHRARAYCQASPPHTDFSACRDCQRQYRYLHALVGAVVLQDLLPADLAGPVSALVGAHHAPDEYGRRARIVALADRLSASERAASEEASDHLHLRSLLTRLHPEGRSPGHPDRFFPLRRLTLDRAALFPQAVPADDPPTAYQRLWAALQADLQTLRDLYGDRPAAYTTSLFGLLQTTLWAVPAAAYHDLADISLYEHLRLTAAFAAALERAGVPDDLLARALAQDPAATTALAFDLIAGDLSGIQDFLYTLTSRAVARGLRGRSFYLDLLTDLVAHWLLARLDLPVCNLLYAGGGRFYLLAPPVPEATFADWRRTLAGAFLERFEGRLYLALTRRRLTAHAIMAGQRYSQVFAQEIGQALARAKDRRFAELPPDTLARTLFAPLGSGEPESLCAICGREGATLPLGQTDPNGLERRQCPVCADLAELGRDLASARYLVVTRAAETAPPSGLWPFLGWQVHLTRTPRLLADAASAERLVLLEPPPGLAALAADLPPRPPPVGWRLLPRITPWDPTAPGEIADFESLAQRSQGAALLGLLRMDVDNLGRLFSRGLGETVSPARLATLSFLLRLFFEGWVGQVCLAVEGAADWREVRCLYVLYAGGDDLFIVGAWDRLPEVAARLRADFAAFTGNPDLTLSGGIVLVPPKLPLYQTARQAREALEAAKAYQRNGHLSKNALTFLGRTVGWEALPRLQADRDLLLALIGAAPEEPVGRRLLQQIVRWARLQEVDRQRTARGGADRPHYGRWVWLAAYTLARLATLYPSHAARLRALAAELRQDPGRLPDYALAARWAELLTRQRPAETEDRR
jgi:CRISPR-associated protein Csm1